MKYNPTVVLSCLFYVFFTLPNAESLTDVNCPSEEDIEPCTCDDTSSEAEMECSNIRSVRTLRNIAFHSANHAFSRFAILNSTLSYIPHELLDKSTITHLELSHNTMLQLFDETPENANSIERLQIWNLVVARRILWEQLEPLTNLRNLYIRAVPIKILGTSFRQHVNKHLHILIFVSTETRKILPGTLDEFKELRTVYFIQCNLTKITRDIFPTPFNVNTLAFSYNQIKEIPADMFKDMPRLSEVRLDRNPIKTIPLSAFNGERRRFPRILLEEDELECFCDLKWIFEKYSNAELKQRGGTCVKPTSLKGKKIGEFHAEKIRCQSK